MNKLLKLKNVNENNNYILFLCVFYILLVHIIYLFIFPPVYGWWQSWVYVTNGNYSDAVGAGYLFPPLYYTYYSFFIDYLKYPIISLVLGVFRTLFIFIFLYKYLGKYYSKFVSSITAYTFVFCIISTNIYLPDDYHTLVTLFILITLASLDSFINSNYKYKNLYLFSLSLFSVLTMLTKQNIGLLLIIGVAASLTFSKQEKLKISSPLLFLLLSILMIISLSYIFKFNLIDLYNISFNNEAKGGKISLLTNLVTNKQNFRQLSIGVVLNFLIFYYIKYGITDNLLKFYEEKKKKIYGNVLISNLIFIISVLIIIYILYSISKNHKDIVIYLAMLTIGFYLSKATFNFKDKGSFLLFPFIFLAIANSFTSSLSQDDMIILCIPVIICIAVHLESILNARKFNINSIFFIIISIIGINIFSNKINNPWSWFGANLSSISFSNSSTPYKELRGIHIDDMTSKLMNSIKHNIDKHSKEKSDVLLYPNIPFFYILHNKIPPFTTPVYWFDTASNKLIDDLIFKLNHKKPELIIFFDPPNFAYKEHSKMKKNEVIQSKFNSVIDDFVRNGTYKLIDFHEFRNTVGLDGEINERKFIVINPDYVGLSPKKISDELKNENIYFENFKLQKDSATENNKIELNEILSIEIKNSDVDKLAKKFGLIPKYLDNFYTLKVYKLNP